MGIGILDNQAAYPARRARGELKPYRRSIIVEEEVEGPGLLIALDSFVTFERLTPALCRPNVGDQLRRKAAQTLRKQLVSRFWVSAASPLLGVMHASLRGSNAAASLDISRSSSP
jgi:hypothetical protein